MTRKTTAAKNLKGQQNGDNEDGQQHDSDTSFNSDNLDDTLVENGSQTAAAAKANNVLPASSPSLPTSSTAPTLPLPTQPFVSPEVLATLISSMTSLKSAIEELRQDSCRNNNEISSLRSQLMEKSSPIQDVENSMYNMSHIHENRSQSTSNFMPPSINNLQLSSLTNNEQVPTSTNHSQQIPQSPIVNVRPSSHYISPNFSTFVSTNNQMPPITNFNAPPTSATSVCAATMPSATQHSDFLTKLYHLPHFEGKPEDWPLFLATYEDTSVEFGYSNRQNLMRLQRALHGPAKDSVMSMLIYPDNVPQIIDELKFNFGRPELLIKSQMEKVKVYPAVTEGRLDGIIGLATCAKNIVSFFKSAKCDHHLMNPTLLEQLVLKLPLSKQYEWAKYSVSVLPFPTVEHFAKWVGDLARFCSLMPQRHTVSTNERQQPTARRVLHSSEVQPARRECYHCKGSHELTDCQPFKDLETNVKWEHVKRLRVCFACLHKGHNLTQCRKRKICTTNGCNRYHHPILHQDISSISREQPAREQPAHVLQCHQNKSTCKLFKILPVMLHGPKGAVAVYALIDDASAVSFLDENVAKSLGLKGQRSSLTVRWYENMHRTETGMKVNAEISSIIDNDRKFAIKNLQTVKELDLPVQSFSKSDFDYLKNLPIKDYQDKKPSILIGLDNCYLSLPGQIVEAGPDLPVATSTKLGWIAYGPTSKIGDNIATVCHINDGDILNNISKMVESYFSIENFGVKDTDLILESDDNKRAREILEKSTKTIDGGYETGLLWKKDDTVLPDSFEMAKQRLIKVENKMAKDLIYAANYKTEMDKYINKGYAKPLSSIKSEANNLKKIWYLPHFGVINPNKPDKLRIVFDAAATSSNVSLNSTLLKGPEHAKPLHTILFQFRQGQIAVAGDIQEMFSQVSIIADDQNSQRFLWRNGEKDREIQTYVMQSMIFGAICSPCCAEYVKNVNANKFKPTMPRGAKAVIDHTYVDDLVISFNSPEDALEVSTEAIQINAAAGFNLRNFSSNCLELEVMLNNGNNGKSNTLNMERQKQTDKILGLYWNKNTDCFEFHVKFHKISNDVLEGRRSPTKREVLSMVMAIFDPFGFLSNFTIFSKLLLQKTWKLCVQWDEQLPQQILVQWNAWWREFDRVKQFSIPRCYSCFLPWAEDIQLHIFVDASSSAFAAVAYLRIKYKDDVHISFVVAKSRCAPPKGMTIPRLELQAAVLGCRLKTSMEESHEFTINRTVFWSDSKTVVLWIHSTVREYKQFVACRIAEILSTTSAKQWKWLPTELNIADQATRANLSVAFDKNSKWLTGPDFLKHEEKYWPTDPQFEETDHYHDEDIVNPIFICGLVNESVLNLKRFSSFLKMKRYAAWVLRFINIYVKKSKKLSTELTAAEIDAGEKLICRLVQSEVYGLEKMCLIKGKVVPKFSNIYSLTPCIDEDMLLRVNGRIDNAYCLPNTARRPIIMPTNHPMTVMIVAYYHQKRHHQNDHLIINEVRQKFWVPNIRLVLKKVKRACPTCVRDSAKPAPPLMGQLPSDRLTPYVRPFSYVGLDYCGPFFVAIGRRREKRWIALFTCLGTRALHLEIALDLSTDAFLICLRNFVNRRGVPIRIRSDNGTNFIGAQKEITAENRFFDFDEIQRNLSKDNIEWIFNCPANPHAGGCWERLVRCVKRLLYKVFAGEAPRLETFRSAMIEAECIINNRPLTELPIGPDSEEPITPNHFLIGGLSSTQTPGPNGEKVCLRKQWRIAQNLKDRLWKRWVVEYLPQLLTRPKWQEEVSPLQPGDIVIILDPSLPRSQWKMGKINQVFFGRDGQVRSAEVKTSSGLIRRPAVKLAVLNFSESSS